MKCLSQKAKTIFLKLMKIMMDNGGYAKIKNSEVYMAVVVESIGSTPLGLEVSVAHYYKQNGDLMADPEMVFLVSDVNGDIYPFSYLQHGLGLNQVAVRLEGSKIFIKQKLQRDITRFANQWMKNIQQQQFSHRKIKQLAASG